MADVQFVRQDDHEIRFAHRASSDVVWTVGLAVVCYFGYRSALGSHLNRWSLSALGLLSAAMGLWSMLWRYELTLDFRSRTWTRRKGFWPLARIRTGAFNDLDGLILAIEIHSTRNFNYPVWVIRLAIKGEPYVD